MTSTIRGIAGALIGSMVLFSAALAETPVQDDFAAHLVDMRTQVAMTVEANAIATANQITADTTSTPDFPAYDGPRYYAEVEFMTAATDYAFVMSKYQFYPVTAN